MSTTLAEQADGRGPFKAWHALLWFLAFFGFMFIVNGIFLWTAITTFPGEDVEKSYAAGLDYNSALARRSLQQEKGWAAEIGLVGTSQGGRIHVRLLTKDAAALSASSVTAYLRHPADRAMDLLLDLQPISAGEYAADITGIHPGIWTVRLTADIDTEHEGADFEAEREFLIP
ncbi:FixH family protein [Hyphomonas sp.]|uniref:FixH family protein n=1 Tax=Hyphomonas sp. TaxID=87 RepID=UPI00391CA2E1